MPGSESIPEVSQRLPTYVAPINPPGEGCYAKTTWECSSDDPIAATCTLSTEEGDITWIVGRDLLGAILRPDTPSLTIGEGDIAGTILKSKYSNQLNDSVFVELALSSPEGSVHVVLGYYIMRKFLETCDEKVPNTLSDNQMDAEIASLFNRRR